MRDANLIRLTTDSHEEQNGNGPFTVRAGIRRRMGETLRPIGRPAEYPLEGQFVFEGKIACHNHPFHSCAAKIWLFRSSAKTGGFAEAGKGEAGRLVVTGHGAGR
jgi:hypothetical protein